MYWPSPDLLTHLPTLVAVPGCNSVGREVVYEPRGPRFL